MTNCNNCKWAKCEDPDGYGPKTYSSYYIFVECAKDSDAWVDDGKDCEDYEEK